MDSYLLKRLDEAREGLGQTRTAFVERAVLAAIRQANGTGNVPIPAEGVVAVIPSERVVLRGGGKRRSPAMDRQAKLNAAKAGKK